MLCMFPNRGKTRSLPSRAFDCTVARSGRVHVFTSTVCVQSARHDCITRGATKYTLPVLLLYSCNLFIPCALTSLEERQNSAVAIDSCKLFLLRAFRRLDCVTRGATEYIDSFS